MVLVSHDHEFVFLKTTKTAGTSAEMALEPFCAGPDHVVREPTETIVSEHGIIGYRGSNKPAPRPAWQFWRDHPWHNHMPAFKVRRNLGSSVFDRYRKITVVRNPFDRLVSFFLYRNRTVPGFTEDFSALRSAFRDFVLDGNWSDDRSIIMIDGKSVIDTVLHKETLAEDLKALASEIGLDQGRIILPHAKSQAKIRKNIPVSHYYDQDMVEAIRRKMSWFFDSFDYPDSPQENGANAPKVTA